MSTNSPAPKASTSFVSWQANHAGIIVGNLDDAIAWYSEKLDLRFERRWAIGEKQFAWLEAAAAPGFIIELLCGPGQDHSAAHEGGDPSFTFRHHLGFHVASVDASVKELAQRSVSVVAEPRDVVGAANRVAFFTDPWGNLFEVTEKITV
ncbi:VOC family protein [Mesorhizobium sp. B2-1-8]|uniref:VOC family protein n=1 Tax=Mesorhizobium sp. B2-1-8 TaxID=2589967 RepID=UPI00112E34A1|nr:VOC family protein [Mesorhizobium sp. B2-1-8]UCI17904.1 VOC family protein [Mesorhizobium sp. B2-1-8]